MARKKILVPAKTKVTQKMYMQMTIMGYNGDYHATIAQALNRRIFKKKTNLSRKLIRKLHYLLYTADTPTLLSFTVSLGRLIWTQNLNAQRRKFYKKLSYKIQNWSVNKKKRKGKPGKFLTWMFKKWRGNNKMVIGFQLRPVRGSKLRIVVCRKIKRQHVKGSDTGSLVYRLAMAMKYLSLRNVCVTSGWEFWMVWFVQMTCGFWGSVAFGDGLTDSFVSVARKFGLFVVSRQHLERLESCFGSSSSLRCLGCRLQ